MVTGVSSSDLVGLLKMKIWQTLGDSMEPNKIELFVEGKLLDNDNATLKSFGVHAHSTVQIRPLNRPTADMQSYFKFTGTTYHQAVRVPINM
jgi:hypothetical protein